jgi:hypothetical protein
MPHRANGRIGRGAVIAGGNIDRPELADIRPVADGRSKSIRLIAPITTGGPSDLAVHVLADKLSPHSGYNLR